MTLWRKMKYCLVSIVWLIYSLLFNRKGLPGTIAVIRFLWKPYDFIKDEQK